MNRVLPSGTVTFLFSDVEGSTRLLHDLGADRYAEVLAEHRRLVRAACTERGGVEVDTQGDALFVAFASAPAAIDAALAAQHALEPLGVRIRVGVHTGTPLSTPEGYVGVDVHRAARIAAAAHGGQVVVSSSTAALVDRALLRDLGEHRLKDLTAPERLHQAGDGEFPPLRALYRTNLPVVMTPLVGRRNELASVAAALEERPALLTLTGPGGTGKTRMAVHAAANAAETFPDGVWWVPLAPVTDPMAVRDATAAAVQCAPEQLASRLAGRSSLVVLDNVEHLLPGAALEVSKLVTETPGCSWLVTSREALRVSAEREHPVPALDPADASELFLARASARGVQLVPSRDLDELCAMLDGLPLAIELAAARTGVFSVEQLIARLGDRLDLFRGARDVDARHQTLRATIQWSWSLLDERERDALARLSVFPAGARLEEAARVAGAGPDVLESLLDKSMVRRRDDPDGAPRFWLLGTIRQFAAEQLDEAGVTAATFDAHTAWVLDLLAASLASAERPLHVCRSVESWHTRDVDAALWRLADVDVVAVADIGFAQFRWPQVLADHASSVEALPANSPERLASLGIITLEVMRRGDGARARSLAERTLSDARRLGDPYALFRALFVAWFVDPVDPSGAAAIEEALRIPPIHDETWPYEKALLLQAHAAAAARAHDHAAVEAIYLDIHRLFGAGGDDIMSALLAAGHAALDGGSYERCAERLLEAIPKVRRSEEGADVFNTLWVAMALASRSGQPDAAARLVGACQSLDTPALQLTEEDLAKLPAVAEHSRGVLGDAEYTRLEVEGAHLSTGDALALAGEVAAFVMAATTNRP